MAEWLDILHHITPPMAAASRKFRPANSKPPLEVKPTLVGSENAFRILNPGQLVVRLDLDRLKQGNQDIKISRRNINLPNSLDLVQSDPAVLRIRAEHR